MGEEISYQSDPSLHRVAVIINNRSFSSQSELNDRDGAEKDLKGMKKMFKRLGFDTIKVYENLKAYEMEEKIQKVCDSCSAETTECFACVINTHGAERGDVHKNQKFKEHILFGKNGLFVYTREILQLVAKTRSLKGIPKLFFIQACRGVQHDKGVNVSSANKGGITRPRQGTNKTDSHSASIYQGTILKDDGHNEMEKREDIDDDDLSDTDIENSGDEDDNDDDDEESETLPEPTHDKTSECRDEADVNPKKMTERVEVHIPRSQTPPVVYTQIPCFNDMLVMFASPTGQYAIRNTRNGSYFLYHLYSVMERTVINSERGYIKSWPDLVTLLTQVSKDLALEVEANLVLRDGQGALQKHQARCVSCVYHCLRKNVVLKPRGEKSKWYSRIS